MNGNQKILLCTVYRELSNLVTPGQMSDLEQREKWKLFMNQTKVASKEGTVLVLGDLNLDLERFEDPTYYKKVMAEEYKSDLGEGGFDTINFGLTWRDRTAIDHCFINRPDLISDYGSVDTYHYSDHKLIYVELITSAVKRHSESIWARHEKN